MIPEKKVKDRVSEDKEPTLEELVREKGPEKFAEGRYSHLSWNLRDCQADYSDDGVLVTATYGGKKEGYPTGRWELYEIKDDESKRLERLHFPLKESHARKTGAIAGAFAPVLGFSLADYLVPGFEFEPFWALMGYAIGGGALGLSVGDKVRKWEVNKASEKHIDKEKVKEKYLSSE